MKKVISLLLSVVILASMFTMLGTTASAADASDVLEINNSGFKDGKVTFAVYVKKNISLIGAIVKVVYDPDVLEVVDGGAHSSSSSANGIFVDGEVSGKNNAYSLAFVSRDAYKIGSKDKGLFKIQFKLKDKSYPKTSVKFYCVEFNCTDSSKKIAKNESNPPLIDKVTTTTLDQLTYKSISRVSNGIKITWEATPGAEGYYVYKDVNGEWEKIATTTSLSYTDKKAKVNKIEKYAVRAYNDAGVDSDYASRSGKFTLSEPNAKVEGVYGGVKITWGKVTRADSYKIYRKYSGGSWKTIATLGADARSYKDTSVKSGKVVYYAVRAGSDGEYSTYESIKIGYVGVPRISKVSNTTSGVKVKWGSIENATSYKVYRKTSSTSWKLVGTTSKTAFTDKKAKSGTTYTYTVRACRGSYTSNYESGESIKYLSAPDMKSVKNGITGVKVTWNDVTGANSYIVYRRGGGSGWEKIAVTKSTSYTDKTAKKKVTYRYTVKAASGSSGNGRLSDFESGLKITRK